MRDYYSITELTREFDISTRTLRFYEDEGLIHPIRRGRTRLFRPSCLSSASPAGGRDSADRSLGRACRRRAPSEARAVSVPTEGAKEIRIGAEPVHVRYCGAGNQFA
jgi:hypothetical protein